MAAFGIKAIQPQDNEHIFGFASARGTADDSLVEVWNGPTNSDLKFTIDKEGQLQSANGSAARPTYSFEAQKTSGRYMSGAGTFLDVIAGTAVGTWTAGKLTLTELQVDNLNINGNTLSSTAGTDLLITPLAGQQIVLDGAIVIDAGVVTGATSITSTAFVGSLTGASTATLVTVADSTDTSSFIAMFDSATGDMAAKTDGGLTYNAGTGMLTATGLTGPLTGLASTATLASTVEVVASSGDTTSHIAMFNDASGSLAALTDPGLTYNATSNALTAATFIGALTGLASTATLAAVATSITAVGNNSEDSPHYPTFVDGASGTQGIETDTGLTYNPSSGTLTSVLFVGGLTGDASGSSGSCTGNSATATLASTVTVAASGGDTTSHIAMFDSAGSGSAQAVKTDPGITYNATSNVLTSTFAGDITGDVTGNADTATVATKATLADEGSDTSCYPTFSLTATGDQPLKTDSSALTYNAGTGVLASTFSGALTGNVTGNVDGSSGSCTGNSATSTVASTVVVAESTDATSFIAMFDANAATTPQAIKSDTGLTYNASNSTLAATTFSGAFSGNASTATLAATVTVIDSTDDSSYIAMFDSATGDLAVKTDTGLTYHAGNGILTATGFAGPLVGNVTGTASVATTVTVTDNENENESNCLTFVAGADQDGGNVGLESDGDLTYNPSTGKVTATGFIGTLTGNVTGNASGTALTVTQAAQTAITSVGTLTALQVDNININLNTISSTAGTDLNITPKAGEQIVLDGTIVIDAGVVTGATSITSTAFVGDITGDVTGNATTVTAADEGSDATCFPAFVTGATGAQGIKTDSVLKYNSTNGTLEATTLAGALSTAAQTAITSVGTLTSLAVGNIASTGLLTVAKTGSTSHWAAVVTNNYDASSDVTVSLAFANSSGRNSGIAVAMDDANSGEYLLNLNSASTERFEVAGDGAVTATGNVSFTAGVMAIGSTANAAVALNITSNDMAGEGQYGLNVNPTFTNDAGTAGYGIRVLVVTDNASFTQTNTYGILIESGYEGSGSTITNLYGLKIEDQASGGTNYAIHTGTGTVALGADLTVATDVSIGTNPAQTGDIRLNNHFGIFSRNAANDANKAIITEEVFTGDGSLEFGDNTKWPAMRFHVSTANVVVLTSTLISLNKAVTANNAAIKLTGLVTSDPGVAGQLWNDTSDGNTLKVSAG